MWIAMNDSFVSVVANRNDPKGVVVRARVKEDLVALFPLHANDIVEMTESDYRWRLFLDKKYVSTVIAERVMNIDYDNFKNSVPKIWRKRAYNNIWATMYNVQLDMYGPQYEAQRETFSKTFRMPR